MKDKSKKKLIIILSFLLLSVILFAQDLSDDIDIDSLIDEIDIDENTNISNNDSK